MKYNTKQPPSAMKEVKGITHKDIAKFVGVSQATVSKVLNNRSNSIGISQKTRQAVIEAAKELGYNKDKVASGLIQLVEKSIGILLEHIANPFCSVIMNGIEHELSGSEYQYLFASSNGVPDRSLKCIQSMSRRFTSGFILMPFYESNTSQSVHRFLKGRGIPFVRTNYHNLPNEYTAPLVASNNYEIFRALTEHLIAQGHRRIAVVHPTAEYSSIADRIRGFRDAMQAAGLEVPASYLVEHARQDYFQIEPKEQLLSGWMRQKNRPTAIMTLKDDCAIQFILLLRKMGLSVPGDMAVTGFDDYLHFLPKFYHEAYRDLTTVRQNLPEIGRQAVKRLLAEIESEFPKDLPMEVAVPAELMIRGSCGATLAQAKDDYKLELKGLGLGYLTH